MAKFLPGNSSLKQLSVASNGLTGQGSLAMVESVSFSKVTDELRQEIEDRQDEVKEVMDKAKKEKRKLDRDGALMHLGLPAITEIDGEPFGKGNRTLEYLNLGSNDLSPEDVVSINSILTTHETVVSGYLKVVKLERICSANAIDVPLSSVIQL